jgi:WD40 repeat protein
MKTEKTVLHLDGKPPIAFHPLGVTLASMDEQGSHVILWDLAESLTSQTGKIQYALGGFTNPVLEVAYSPDGNRLGMVAWFGKWRENA